MIDRPRPDESLPPGQDPRAQDRAAARPTERGAGHKPGRLAADIMAIGSWHDPAQTAQSGGPRPTAADLDEPGAPPGGGESGGLGGARAAPRAELEAAFGAGFTYRADRDRARREAAHREAAHRDSGDRDSGGRGEGQAAGFAAGGVLDQMLPGAELGCYLAAARRPGFGRLSDYELCGVIAAYRRQASCDTAGELAAIAELDARRAGPGGRPG